MTIPNATQAAIALQKASDYWDPGAQLKKARSIAGWTQQQLADRLDVTQQEVSDWETGQRRPGEQTRQKFRALADELLD
jgi:transcriptional regulator with XRE-family HTH domain